MVYKIFLLVGYLYPYSRYLFLYKTSNKKFWYSCNRPLFAYIKALYSRDLDHLGFLTNGGAAEGEDYLRS